jgi:hypothetical protein
MQRISVSDLDCYRRYKANEDVTLDETIAQLRRERPPSPAMLAGSALHKILEESTYSDEYTDSVNGYGYEFYFGGCDVDLKVPPVRELKGEIEIETPSGSVTLVGVVDAIEKEISDYKLSGYFDAEKLMNNYQWRCYLVMFAAQKFVYKVFVGKEDDKAEDVSDRPRLVWTITDYHELPVYRYPGIEADVQKEVAEFAAFRLRYVDKN